MPAARHVTADPIQRRDSLLDDNARRNRDPETPGDLFPRDRANVIGCFANRPPDRGWGTQGAFTHLPCCELDRAAQLVESPRVADERAVSASPHSRHNLTDALFNRAPAFALNVDKPVDRRCLARSNDPDRSPISSHLPYLILF